MENLDSSSQGVQLDTQNSEATLKIMTFTGLTNTFAPKVSIKLQENNFLLLNQQVEGVILSHKLHKIVVNPRIPPMFKTESDRIENIVSKAYEEWIVQDQALFTWLLSTISESVLPCVLS